MLRRSRSPRNRRRKRLRTVRASSPQRQLDACRRGHDTGGNESPGSLHTSSLQKQGPITTDGYCCAIVERRVRSTTSAAEYGSLLSQGRHRIFLALPGGSNLVRGFVEFG